MILEFLLHSRKIADYFEDLHKLELLANSDVNLTSFLGGVTNYVFNVKFIIPPRNEIRLTSKFVTSSSL